MASIIGVETLQHTNGTTAATIDSSGSIAIEQYAKVESPVAFNAYLTGNITGFDTTNFALSVAFNATTYNLNNNFQTSGSDIGLFVAPHNGIYSFDGWIYSAVSTFSQVWLTLNGSRMNYTDLAKGINRAFVGGTWNVKLSAGDKVGLHPYNTGTSEQINSSGSHTYFRGHLVYKV
jgi:hypothetical protein